MADKAINPEAEEILEETANQNVIKKQISLNHG
jgi:hypothetical protein